MDSCGQGEGGGQPKVDILFREKKIMPLILIIGTLNVKIGYDLA